MINLNEILYTHYINLLIFGTLPKDFNQWDIADNSGRTVAHVAAKRGKLPKDFNQWDIADNSGQTVAHEAALYFNIPDNFDQWELKNKFGVSVKDVYDTVSLIWMKNNYRKLI